MRTVMSILFACCTLLAPAHAAERAPSSAELQDYVGQYTLADGRILSITQQRHRLIAQVGGDAPATLAPAGPAQFAAPDRGLRLTFDQRRNGNVAAVTLTQKEK